MCSIPFHIRVLNSISQHIITPKKGHTNEVNQLDVGLWDCIIRQRLINIGYVILRHMLSTLGVVIGSFLMIVSLIGFYDILEFLLMSHL